MTLQQQADEILARSVMVVCDGWVKPQHPRVMLSWGNPDNVSHGMCDTCVKAYQNEMVRELTAVGAKV